MAALNSGVWLRGWGSICRGRGPPLRHRASCLAPRL